MSKRDDAYRPFQNIKDRLDEVAASLGLEVARVIVNIDEDHMIQVVWTVKPDAVLTEIEKEQIRMDKSFEDLTTGLFDDPIEVKVENARDKLRAMLEGYGPDEEDEPEQKALGTGDDEAPTSPDS